MLGNNHDTLGNTGSLIQCAKFASEMYLSHSLRGTRQHINQEIRSIDLVARTEGFKRIYYLTEEISTSFPNQKQKNREFSN